MLNTDIQNSHIAQAVEEGFAKTPKRLPSWLFYDETGDRIFQEIMRMPEYYLTNCEYEIFQTYREAFRKHFSAEGEPFELVELGAGDGFKTEIVLKHLSKKNTAFSYHPVDVSESVLEQLSGRLKNSIPGLTIKPINKQYSEAISALKSEDNTRKVFLFLGANIGNFDVYEAIKFMRQIAAGMNFNDQLLVGFDLKKDPRLVQAAYDDPHGITRDFNMNLLIRLNRELGANFNTDQFKHYPFYDPETGMTKSYLVSLKDQEVYFDAFERAVALKRWELIHTEVSQKYDTAMIEKLAEDSGLEVVHHFYDCKHYFCDVLFKRSNRFE